MTPDEDARKVAAQLVGAAAGAIVADSMHAGALLAPLAPIRVESADAEDGIVRLRLANGLLATIRVTVSQGEDFRAGWYHHGHNHRADEGPHDHPLGTPFWGH